MALASVPKFEIPMLTNVAYAPAGEILGSEMTSRDGRQYNAFYGIPYAEPPLGTLRFKPPKPIPKLKGRFNATTPQRNCMQNLDPNSSEDCLHLNVFRPKTTQENGINSGMPVLFYIYGGGFSAGSSGPPNNADYLMDENVVLVSPNYRLGIFGFPSFGNHIMSGNYGLKDLVLALRWVKDNILAFGGDPDNVTVFGGSAGGAIAQILMKSPVSENLVTKAYSYSGTINPFWSQVATAPVKRNTLQVAKYVKCCRTLKTCSVTQEVFECMQKANVTEVLKSASILSMKLEAGRLLTFAPVVEPKDIQDAVITEDLSLKLSHKPWMTSVTNGEYSVFLDTVSVVMLDHTRKHVEDNVHHIIEAIVKHSIHNSKLIQNGTGLLEKSYFRGHFMDDLSKFLMNLFFIYPQIYNIMRHKGPKWMATLEFHGELSMGPDSYAGHADQGIFLFNYRDLYAPEISFKETAEDYKMTRKMVGYLANFSYYSDPTPEGSPVHWDKFTNYEVLRMTAKGDFMGDKKYFRSFRGVYQKMLNALGWNYS